MPQHDVSNTNLPSLQPSTSQRTPHLQDKEWNAPPPPRPAVCGSRSGDNTTLQTSTPRYVRPHSTAAASERRRHLRFRCGFNCETSVRRCRCDVMDRPTFRRERGMGWHGMAWDGPNPKPCCQTQRRRRIGRSILEFRGVCMRPPFQRAWRSGGGACTREVSVERPASYVSKHTHGLATILPRSAVTTQEQQLHTRGKPSDSCRPRVK